jgi:hypothetical protein
MAGNKPTPKSQEQLSQDLISNYKNPDTDSPIQDKAPLSTAKNRENQIRRDNDKVRNFTIGVKDIDEAIHYYFNEVIRPSVVQNGKTLNVPLVYGSPERWASVQKDGFYRDKNGKMQAPIIMFKRDSIEKNRSLGNKLDGNSPHNYGIFEKKFSKKNVYDKFDILNNRVPEKEYYAVSIPDYVNITYSCIIFTDYLEQNNKIIESVNYASDAYWGEPNRFSFRAMIDSYNTVTEVSQGNERINKTDFQINLLGHLVPDSINAQTFNASKFFSKSSVKFGLETEGKL